MYVKTCAAYAVCYLVMFGSKYDEAYVLKVTNGLFALNCLVTYMLFVLNCLVACMLQPVLTML